MASARGVIPKGDLLSVRFMTKGLALKVPDLTAINRQMALRVQESVVAAFEASLSKREQRTSQYLKAALESEEAIVYNSTGFVYLPRGYLDKSPARLYWRNLELGTDKFEDRVLRGYFVSGGDKFSAPGEGELDQRFAGTMTRTGGGAVIKNPILAHEYITKGVKDWQESSGTQPLRDAVKEIRVVTT